jgi:phenylalanyl-tRNA synthetase beta chain
MTDQPPTRSDILHSVDVVEDVAIAYGFNNLLPGTVPPVLTVGQPLPLNHFCDQLRDEIARAGYMEMLTHGLCMTAENFEYLGRPNSGLAVQLSNPANEEYEVVRTTLLPGMLKTLHHNKSMPKKAGIKFFEISDVVVKDEADPIGARNERRLVAAYAGLSAGFEVVHGLVDRVMALNQVSG